MGCVIGAVSFQLKLVKYNELFFYLQLGCCCGSAACSLCCACCPSTRNSLVTRLAYGILLLVGMIVSWIFLIPGLAGTLKKVNTIEFYKLKFFYLLI